MARKSTKIESVESKGRLQDTLDKLNKTYGIGTILSLDDKVSGEYDVISSGSIGMDYITLGIGGFAKGKLYEIMSWEGGGKSTLCGHAAAECQKSGGTVLYIDSEHAVDRNYFQALGVDTTKMYIAQPSNGEEGFQIAKDMISSGEVDLVIIDSDSSLIPKAIIDGEVGDSALGKKARLNSGAYPALKSLLVLNKVCVIVVSQYREKIGVMFGNPTTTQGGHALKFYSDVRIEINRTLAKDGDVSYGNITKVKTVKNKMYSPYRITQFDIVWGEGIDKAAELLDLGIEYKILEKFGNYYSYDGTKIGNGRKDAKTILKDNPELMEELRAKIISKITNTTEFPLEDANDLVPIIPDITPIIKGNLLEDINGNL